MGQAMSSSLGIEVDENRVRVARAGGRLQWLTIAWNSAECLVALAAGFLAGSVALVGFGFDLAIEVTSSLAALWRLRRDRDEAERERAERGTLRFIGACFLLLAAYVLYDALDALVAHRAPERSIAGLALAAASLAVMPALAHFSSHLLRSLTRLISTRTRRSGSASSPRALRVRAAWWSGRARA